MTAVFLGEEPVSNTLSVGGSFVKDRVMEKEWKHRWKHLYVAFRHETSITKQINAAIASNQPFLVSYSHYAIGRTRKTKSKHLFLYSVLKTKLRSQSNLIPPFHSPAI